MDVRLRELWGVVEGSWMGSLCRSSGSCAGRGDLGSWCLGLAGQCFPQSSFHITMWCLLFRSGFLSRNDLKVSKASVEPLGSDFLSSLSGIQCRFLSWRIYGQVTRSRNQVLNISLYIISAHSPDLVSFSFFLSLSLLCSRSLAVSSEFPSQQDTC